MIAEEFLNRIADLALDLSESKATVFVENEGKFVQVSEVYIDGEGDLIVKGDGS